jgi:hypothetical protein
MESIRRTLLTLSLSLVAGTAAVVAVRGLTALFATTLTTKVLMATMAIGLEVGKLAIVTHLHARWTGIKWPARCLLVFVALVIMSLTSFEFLGLITSELGQVSGGPAHAIAATFDISLPWLVRALALILTAVVEPLSLGLTVATVSAWESHTRAKKAAKAKKAKASAPKKAKPKPTSDRRSTANRAALVPISTN